MAAAALQGCQSSAPIGRFACCGAGQLGVGNVSDFYDRLPFPTKVLGKHKWLLVSAGGTHTCGVTTANQTLCFGSNVEGWGERGLLPSPAVRHPVARRTAEGASARCAGRLASGA
jgi:hypothetical protein